MHRSLSLVLTLAAAALLLGPGAPVAVAVAGAHAAPRDSVRCSVGSGEGDGYTYLLRLVVSDTTCASGLKLARDKGRLAGWKCTHTVIAHSPVQYEARETCTAGRARVDYEFTENT